VHPLRVPILAAVLFVALAGALDAFWRTRGYQPSVVDGKDRWCAQRDRVYGERTIVLMGDSRIMFNVDPAVLRERLPGYEVAQLGIGATQGAAVLRDLARDRAFRGVVIASMRAESFERSQWDSQQDFVDHCRDTWNADRKLSERLRTALTSRLVVLSPTLSLRQLGREWVRQGVLPHPWLVLHADRGMSADFSSRNPNLGMLEDTVREHYAKATISPPDEWLEAAGEVERWIRRIHSRGGRVAIVRFPTSGPYWELDERHYPRARYWDAFAARTSAVAIHFRDVPAMRKLPLPDASHVDWWNKPAFTESLVDELVRAGLFPGAATREPGRARRPPSPRRRPGSPTRGCAASAPWGGARGSAARAGTRRRSASPSGGSA
jgi:hypothetical protein